MKKLFLLLSALCFAPVMAPEPAAAQTCSIIAAAQAAGHFPVGSNIPLYCLQTGELMTSAAVSASISGFPGATPTTGTPISVTTGGVTGTLPAGTVVVATNVGTTNGAYCKLGASATTSDQFISPNGGWFAFTVGAATQLTCITGTSTTTVNMVGGSGLPTGTGGGGGGSGGGAVTVADSADVTEGGVSDAVATQGGTGTLSAKLRLVTSQLNTGNTSLATIATNTGASVPAGTAIIGYTSNDVCAYQAKLTAPFSTSSGGPVSIVALSGSTKVYVCSISAITDTAIKLSFIDGTGGSCASAQHAIWGSTTAANGMSLAANGGFTMGSGSGTVGVTAAASAFCLLQSGTSLVSGNITYVQQ